MVQTKRKVSKKQKNNLITQEIGDNKVVYWFPVGTLPKVTSFRSTAAQGPMDSLHARIRKLLPDIREVQQVGVSPATNKYLEKELTKYARKKYKHLSQRKQQTAVAFTMLDLSPCDVEGAEDFVLYQRLEYPSDMITIPKDKE